MSEPTGYVHPGRHPHEVLVCVTAVLVGILGLVAPGNVSASITQAFPGVLANIYFITLVVAGLLCMYGISVTTMVGPFLERAGLIILGAWFAAYGVALLARNGEAAYVSCILPFAYAVANGIRVWQINRALKAAKRDIE